MIAEHPYIAVAFFSTLSLMAGGIIGFLACALLSMARDADAALDALAGTEAAGRDRNGLDWPHHSV